MDPYQCAYCQSIITSHRIKCAECPDFTLCLQVCQLENSYCRAALTLGCRILHCRLPFRSSVRPSYLCALVIHEQKVAACSYWYIGSLWSKKLVVSFWSWKVKYTRPHKFTMPRHERHHNLAIWSSNSVKDRNPPPWAVVGCFGTTYEHLAYLEGHEVSISMPI